MSVDHRATLEVFQLLRHAIPTAVVTGRQETARAGALVFTLELARTIRSDAYDGVVVTVISPAVGKLDAAHFAFGEHGLPVERRELNNMNQSRATGTGGWGDLALMAAAVADYVAAFTD
jgi:hypothetical protein